MPLLRTPLFDWHCGHGARMVEFGGWEMPVQYTSILDEHHAVRTAAGLFDISHMGRLTFRGPDSSRLLDHLLTCRVDNLVDGQVRYGLVCKTTGGVLDDVLVNQIDSQAFRLVVNASNREKIVNWIDQQINNFKAENRVLDVVVEDHTSEMAMFAIQGPRSVELVKDVTNVDLASMRYYTGCDIQFRGVRAFISRTGYTGEDGFELIVASESANVVWESFNSAGFRLGLKPCGLGCRDTLRLEAAMPLYGHELTENIDPITAGLGFAVKLDKPEFIGREALISIKEQPLRAARVGLKLASRRIAREHCQIYIGSDEIGVVSSGTFSPTLEQSIAMAYVSPVYSAIGTVVDVDVRGRREPAEIVVLPFYKRTNGHLSKRN